MKLPFSTIKLIEIIQPLIETFISAHIVEHSKILKDPDQQKIIAINDFLDITYDYINELKKDIKESVEFPHL